MSVVLNHAYVTEDVIINEQALTAIDEKIADRSCKIYYFNKRLLSDSVWVGWFYNSHMYIFKPFYPFVHVCVVSKVYKV
jgi:hypothetical protein